MRYFVQIHNSWAEPYEDSTQKNRAFIVMEYCKNKDLNHYKKKIAERGNKLTSEEILYLAREILIAIYLLHRFKIVHLE